MKKYISLIFLAGFCLSLTGMISAQEEPAQIATEETITISDLGVSDPGMLPTSPFYFLKEWSRGLRSFITFNPVAKTELELKFANEKAAELKEVADTKPQNTEAIQKALKNYQNTQEKLREKFEGLKETSQNPNVDKLLDNLTDKVVKHEKLFDEIAFKFKEREGISSAINNTKTGSEELIGSASDKDEPAKFASRLEKVLLEENGGDLKHARSVEIIDNFSNKAADGVKTALKRLREEFSEKLEIDIENLVRNEGENALKERVAITPGDIAKRSVIIEEIQKRAEEHLSQAMGKAMDQIEILIQKEADINQKAKEQIERAEKIIKEAEEKISESEAEKISGVVSTLLTEATGHLKNAASAFEEKKYGEAFGRARSAEVLARNALRFFEEERPETQNFERQLKELEEKIRIYKNLIEERGLTEEQKQNAREMLNNNALVQLDYAKENLADEDFEKVKTYINYIKRTFLKLSGILERKTISAPAASETIQTPLQMQSTAKPITPIDISCEDIQKKIIELKKLLAEGRMPEPEFKEDYNVKLRELIVCQERKNETSPAPVSPTPPAPVSPAPTACTLEYNPVCGSNGKTYSNACFAKAAGAIVSYRGECKTETGAITPAPTESTDAAKPAETNISPAGREVKLEADDSGFYPDSTIKVVKGSRVKLTFFVRPTNVYYGGLDMRSNVFKTGVIKPGNSETVEFTASESFEFTSYWPLSNIKKATGKVVVE